MKGNDSGRKLKREQHAEQDDDSDIPEVLTMTEGRERAQKVRNEERESGRRIAVEAKRRRQEKAAKRHEDKTRSQVMAVALRQELKAGGDEAAQQQPNTGGLLDDTIVQFLSAREKAGFDEEELKILPLTSEEQKKPIKSKKEKTCGRVQVILLNRELPSVDRSAMEFKNNHLFGDRIKRDLSMLKNKAKIFGF